MSCKAFLAFFKMSTAACQAFHRSPELAVNPWPSLQGNLPPDGAHLCLCPHPLKSRLFC